MGLATSDWEVYWIFFLLVEECTVVISKGMDTVVSSCEMVIDEKEGGQEERTLRDTRVNVMEVRDGTNNAYRDSIDRPARKLENRR